MFSWMRRYEQMVDEFVDGIIVASEEFVAHQELQDPMSNLCSWSLMVKKKLRNVFHCITT